MLANTSPPKFSRAWKARRKKAQELFAAGEKQSAVARKLAVSRQCVHNWFWQWQGYDLRPKGPRKPGSGRKSKLEAKRWAEVDQALRRGPAAYGYDSERWTLWRVAAVIERITGIRYHPSSVWRILRMMGWTLKLPPKARRKTTGYVARHWSAPPQTPAASGSTSRRPKK
jgi:transposase